MADHAMPTVVMCDEPSTLRMALAIHLERAGFQLIGVFDRLRDLLAAPVPAPELLVLDLVQVGPSGVRGVTDLRAAFPGTVLAVFVPVPTLDTATLTAGADEVFVDTDLRRFAAFARELGERLTSPAAPGP